MFALGSAPLVEDRQQEETVAYPDVSHRLEGAILCRRSGGRGNCSDLRARAGLLRADRGVDLRVNPAGRTVEQADAIIQARLGKFIFSTEREELETVIASAGAKKATLTVPESCTGRPLPIG